jgi:D-alanine-D-alanine ligase
MKKLRIIVLVHEDLIPPPSIEGVSDKEMAPWKTEYDVITALEELGHEVAPLGVAHDPFVIQRAIEEFKPQVVFNLLEEFHGLGSYVPHVLGFLELMRQPYTGCNPHGMSLTRNKALMKKILRFHRVPTPPFAVFQPGRSIRRPRQLEFPLIVKSTTEHGSVGIAQKSIVYDDQSMHDRVIYVHEQLHTEAIVEEYVDGREIYVGVIGNHRLQNFPLWEMDFSGIPEGAPKIATEKVKWDLGYQVRTGIKTHKAGELPDGLESRITKLSKRVYRLLGQTGYARMDLRVTPDGKAYVLESNPNPQLAYGEDFAESAHLAGLDYLKLIQRIVTLGLNYVQPWKDYETLTQT